MQLAPACVSWAGLQGFGCLLSLAPSSSPPAQGPSKGGWSPAPEREHRQETDQHCTDGRGQCGFSSTTGSQWLPFFQGQGRLAKCVSGQALLQGCHPTALLSNARPGRKPHLKTDQAEIAVALGELFDYQSQSWDVTPPLPSTCAWLRGPRGDLSMPLCEPCTLSLRELVLTLCF